MKQETKLKDQGECNNFVILMGLLARKSIYAKRTFEPLRGKFNGMIVDSIEPLLAIRIEADRFFQNKKEF